MRRHSSVTLTVIMLALSSCSPQGPGEEPAGGESAPAAVEASGETAPIALTDERLDRYLKYRREVNESYARWQKDAIAIAESVDSKSTDISKALTISRRSMALGAKQEQEMKALREKHGFTEAEDDRLSQAISDVLGARPLQNPGMEGALKAYRDMQAAGGDQKKTADEMLASLEAEEKEALDRARESYGAECVEVLSRRVKDLFQFQMETVKLFTHQGVDGAK